MDDAVRDAGVSHRWVPNGSTAWVVVGPALGWRCCATAHGSPPTRPVARVPSPTRSSTGTCSTPTAPPLPRLRGAVAHRFKAAAIEALRPRVEELSEAQRGRSGPARATGRRAAPVSAQLDGAAREAQPLPRQRRPCLERALLGAEEQPVPGDTWRLLPELLHLLPLLGRGDDVQTSRDTGSFGSASIPSERTGP